MFPHAQLASLTKYPATTEILLWLSLEVADCDPLDIDNVLGFLPKDRACIQNPITLHSLKLLMTLNILCDSNFSFCYFQITHYDTSLVCRPHILSVIAGMIPMPQVWSPCCIIYS